MWEIILCMTMATLEPLCLGFNSLETCQEVRAQYTSRADVIQLEPCRLL